MSVVTLRSHRCRPLLAIISFTSFAIIRIASLAPVRRCQTEERRRGSSLRKESKREDSQQKGTKRTISDRTRSNGHAPLALTHLLYDLQCPRRLFCLYVCNLLCRSSSDARIRTRREQLHQSHESRSHRARIGVGKRSQPFVV